jgi:hypothetical protein
MDKLKLTFEVTVPLKDVMDEATIANEFGGSLRAVVQWFNENEGELFFLVNWPEEVKLLSTERV